MFAHHLKRHGVALDAAIDINPGKQGRFLAATGLAVGAPQAVLAGLADGSEIYVMNSNYLDEIRHTGGERFRYVSVDRP